MPTVEKVGGPRVVVRDIGEFSPGDRADVSDEAAAYLVDECGDFAYVDGAADGEVREEDGPPDDVVVKSDPGAQIDAGECPWCDEYDGENVGMHAARAHPDAWGDYTQTEA